MKKDKFLFIYIIHGFFQHRDVRKVEEKIYDKKKLDKEKIREKDLDKEVSRRDVSSHKSNNMKVQVPSTEPVIAAKVSCVDRLL